MSGLDPRVSVYRVVGCPVGLGMGWGGQDRVKDRELDVHWVWGCGGEAWSQEQE